MATFPTSPKRGDRVRTPDGLATVVYATPGILDSALHVGSMFVKFDGGTMVVGVRPETVEILCAKGDHPWHPADKPCPEVSATARIEALEAEVGRLRAGVEERT